MWQGDPIKSRLTVFCWVLLGFAAVAADVAAAAPTPAQVLAELRSRRDSLENWEVEATWEDYEAGKPAGWEVQTVWRDNLGRTRYRYYHGDGPLPPEDKLSEQGRFVDDLYNGEVTVNLISDPARSRLGDPLAASDRKADTENRYRAATIYEGRFPRQSGIESHREPVTFVIFTVIEQLSALLAAGKAVTVEPVSGQQDVYQLGYQLDPKDDEDRMTHQVVVDAGKGWVITRHEQFFPNGKSARRRTCEYQRTPNGVWMPAKGQIRNLWGGDPSGLDWRFTVRRAMANNPQFDQSIFDVRIPPKFYVSDMRQKVSYWAKDEVVLVAKLTPPAQEARGTKAEAGTSEVLAAETGRPLWVVVLFLGVGILLVLVLGLIVLRRRMAGLSAT